MVGMALDLKSLTKSHWRKYALGFLLWTLLILLCFVQEHAALILKGVEVPWTLLLQRCAEEWYAWALLSLGILELARRFPLEPGRLRRRVCLHVAGSLLTALVYCALIAARMHGEKSVIDGTVFTFSATFQKLAYNYLFFYVLFYWLFVLGQHGWHYFQQARERERQAAALATELVQARLETLRMQLNPHFLFNTLNTISALVHDNPKAADRMVVRLSELLRRTLDQTTHHEVPLRQELDFLKGYLEIEQMRFADRLSVAITVEPGTEDLLVPRLILQPLVENAIRHGIEPREDMGRVDISARRADDKLELKVRDNGNGLPEANSLPHREGIGLSNTRSRLAHLYGPQHRFDLAPVPGGGLEVRLVIPCRTIAEPYSPRVVIMSGSRADGCGAELKATQTAASPR